MRKLTREEKYLSSEEGEWAIPFLIEAIKQCPKNKENIYFKDGKPRADNINHYLSGTIEADELRRLGELDCESCWVAVGGYEWICEALREQSREGKTERKPRRFLPGVWGRKS